MTSITARMTGWYALAVTGAVVVALGAGRWFLSREMTSGIDKLHDAEFREVVQQLGGNPNEMTRTELTRKMTEHSEMDEDLFFFQVNDEKGQVFFRSPNLGATVLPDDMNPGEAWVSDIPTHGRVRGAEFHIGAMHFQIGSRLEPMERVLRQYTQVSLLLVGIVAVGSVGVGYGISRVALRPIRAIERTARRISADNLNERIPAPPGGDEVTELVGLLNAMFDRLEKSFQQVGRFSADASHELKTPLTLIRLNTERVRSQVVTDPAAVAAVDGLLEEIASMQQVINRLLFLAKAEGGALPLTREQHATADVMTSIAEDALVLAEDAGLKLELVRNDAGQAVFDQGLLRQVLLNLVSNGVSVMRGTGMITLSSSRLATMWRIEVTDEGPGLPPEQLERIFERFVQLPRADGAPATGNGLGLAICRSIVELHGGKIEAHARNDRVGLRITIDIPA
ncbi:ATP-binding protein [Oleiharenicola lentus]|uniref:ATP-binding protein n=1 Tax=Oleiharenicola lentus TaxID=2508720 RepID=UPI003F66D7F2